MVFNNMMKWKSDEFEQVEGMCSRVVYKYLKLSYIET